MRIVYGCAAAVLWCIMIGFLMTKYKINISGELQLLTIAIIVAGGMAGGD